MNRCQYFFFFNDTATTEIYTLSLHDALPICRRTLHFTREVETAIYNTLPHNLASLLHHHPLRCPAAFIGGDRKSTRMNSSHQIISYAVFCLKKKKRRDSALTPISTKPRNTPH